MLGKNLARAEATFSGQNLHLNISGRLGHQFIKNRHLDKKDTVIYVSEGPVSNTPINEKTQKAWITNLFEKFVESQKNK